MSCYFALIEDEQECATCSRATGPGLVAWTDEHIIGPRLVPICGACLHGLDRRLYVVWRLANGWARPMKSRGDRSIVDIMEDLPPDHA